MTPMKIGAFGKEFSNHFDEQTVRTDQNVRKYWSDLKLKPKPAEDDDDKAQRKIDEGQGAKTGLLYQSTVSDMWRQDNRRDWH